MTRMTTPALAASIIAMAINYPPASMRAQLAKSLTTLLDRERPRLEGNDKKLTADEREAIALAMGPPSNTHRPRGIVAALASQHDISREHVHYVARAYWLAKGHTVKRTKLTAAQRKQVIERMGPTLPGVKRPRGLCAAIARDLGCNISTVTKIAHNHWRERQGRLAI